MSWQQCAAEHCYSDATPDGRYCAVCADQMVATGHPMQLAWRLLKTDPSLMEPAGYLPVEGNEQLMVDAMQKPRYGETQFFNQMAGHNTAAKYPNWMTRDHADNIGNYIDRRRAMIEAPGKSMYDSRMNDISRDKLISGGHVLTDAVHTDQPLMKPAKGAGGEIDIGGGKTGRFNIAHPTSTRAGNLPHIRDKDRQGIERRAIHPQAASMAARNPSGGGGGGWVQRVIPEEEHPDFFDRGVENKEGIVETIGSDDVFSYTAPHGVHERFHPQARQAIRDLVGQEAYGSEEEKQAAMRDAVAHLDRGREEYDPKRAWGGWASDKWDRFKEGLGEIKPWLRETFRRSDEPMDYAWRLLKTNPDDLFDEDGNFNPLRARSTPPQKAPVNLCGTTGCNEPGTRQRPGKYEGEGGKWYCQSCYDNMMQEDRFNLFRLFGMPLPEDGGK